MLSLGRRRDPLAWAGHSFAETANLRGVVVVVAVQFPGPGRHQRRSTYCSLLVLFEAILAK